MQLSNHWRVAGQPVWGQAVWSEWVSARILLAHLPARIERHCSVKRRAEVALRESQPSAADSPPAEASKWSGRCACQIFWRGIAIGCSHMRSTSVQGGYSDLGV